jgi:serine/threonine-protein kinase RsbW
MKYKLILENNISCIDPVLSLLESVCTQCGFSANEYNGIRLAVEEVISNVINYAFDAHDSENTFEIEINETNIAIEVIVREKGIPFTLDEAPVYDPSKVHTMNDFMEQKGLGLFLASKMTDKFEHKYLGADGNETTIIKYIRHSKMTQAEQTTTSYVFTGNEDDIQIGLFKTEDAIGVARCLYLSYGYSYLKSSLYNPDCLKALAEQENTIIVTATYKDKNDPNTIVAGVVIGSEDETLKGIVELGSLVVSPAFRGLHLAEKLSLYLEQRVNERKKNGFFAECVTVHMASQRSCLSVGMRPCCFFFNYISNDIHFKNFENQKADRQTLVAYYKNLAPFTVKINGSTKLEFINSIVQHILKRLNIDIETVLFDEPLPKKSTVQLDYNAVFGICVVHLTSAGADFKRYLKNVLASPQFYSVKTWVAYFKLDDPNLDFAIDEAEKCNFFFSGILPGSDNGNFLIMQKVSSVVFEEIELARPDDDLWLLNEIYKGYEKVSGQETF